MKGKTITFLLVGLMLAALIVHAALDTILVVSPVSNQNITGEFGVDATTPLNDNVTNMTYWFTLVNDGTNSSNFSILYTDGNATWNGTFNTSVLIDGEYNLTVQASNQSGSVFANPIS